MKRKALIGLLAFTGGVAIVGSGFASWYFGSSDLAKDQAVNTYVTKLVGDENIGELTYGNTNTGSIDDLEYVFVVADQGGYSNKVNANKGLYITAAADEHISDTALGFDVETLYATYSISGENFDYLRLAGLKGTFTATFEIVDTAQAYVQFNSSYSTGLIHTSLNTGSKNNSTNVVTYTGTTTKIEYKYDVMFTDTENVDYDATNGYQQKFSFDVSTDSTTLENKLLSYVSKPQSAAEYATMENALKSGVLKINYSFAVSDATK